MLTRSAFLGNEMKGSSLAEVAMGLVIFIPVLIVLSDLFMLLFGIQLSDATCQDAARVAASGDPSTAEQRAAAIVSRANTQSKGVLSDFQLVDITDTTQASQYANGGPVKGSVTVKTQVKFAPQFLQWCARQSVIKLTSQKTCPFTYIKPPPK